MKEPYRAIKLEGTDLVLNLSKATKIKSKKKLLHLDELEDKSWRLTFSEAFIDDFTKITSLSFISDKLIKIEGLNEQISISKISPIQGEKNMIHLEELDNSSFRFLYSKSLIPDLKMLSSFKIIRELITI